MGRRLMRSPATNTLPRGVNSPLSSSVTAMDDNMTFESSDDRDTNNYKLLLDTFIALLQRDRDLLNYVFPKELQSLVFTKLIELPLAHMREEAVSLCESIERLPHKLDTGKSAVYGIFSILKWFLKSRPTFSKLYQVNFFFPRKTKIIFISRKVMLLEDNNSQHFRQPLNNQ
jgi:hypothetical protein